MSKDLKYLLLILLFSCKCKENRTFFLLSKTKYMLQAQLLSILSIVPKLEAGLLK